MKNYNLTQLHPELAFERHVFHRDMFAHFLRWTYILKIAKIGMNILDVGCGSGNLYEVFYRNRYSPKNFIGVDIRKQTIEQNRLKFPKANWEVKDIVNDELPIKDWDIIASLEVAEHVGKSNGQKYLDNIKKVMNEKTLLIISTPCFNGEAADNHTYNCGDGKGIIPQEYSYEELFDLLSNNFKIEKVKGTFCSQKDIKEHFNDFQKKMFEELKDYYDSNIVSVMMAPIMPAKYSRNCIWTCKLK